MFDHFSANTLHLQHSAYTVSQKNDTNIAHYNFNAHRPIPQIFGIDIAEWVRYRMVICYPTSPN